MKNIIYLIITILLVSCSSIPNKIQEEDIIFEEDFDNYSYYDGKASKEYDEFTKGSKFISDSINTKQRKDYTTTFYEYFIRGFSDEENEYPFQVYVKITYFFSWRFYNSAVVKDYENIEFNVIDTDFTVQTNDSVFYETLGITIYDKNFITDNKDTEIKIYSKSGHDDIITITKRQKESILNLL